VHQVYYYHKVWLALESLLENSGEVHLLAPNFSGRATLPGYTGSSFKMISFANINKQLLAVALRGCFVSVESRRKSRTGRSQWAGKPTLFRMVVGEETPDEGAVSVPKKLTIGCFRQDVIRVHGSSSAALTDLFTFSGS